MRCTAPVSEQLMARRLEDERQSGKVSSTSVDGLSKLRGCLAAAAVTLHAALAGLWLWFCVPYVVLLFMCVTITLRHWPLRDLDRGCLGFASQISGTPTLPGTIPLLYALGLQQVRGW